MIINVIRHVYFIIKSHFLVLIVLKSPLKLVYPLTLKVIRQTLKRHELSSGFSKALISTIKLRRSDPSLFARDDDQLMASISFKSLFILIFFIF